jgi:hypothetical protein
MGALLWLRPVQIDASGGVFGAFFSPRGKCSFMPGLSVISGIFRLLGRAPAPRPQTPTGWSQP